MLKLLEILFGVLRPLIIGDFDAVFQDRGKYIADVGKQ